MGYTNHRIWTNEASTLLVQAWDIDENGIHVEVAERDDPSQVWGPPTQSSTMPSWIGNLIQRKGPEADASALAAEEHLDGGTAQEIRRAFHTLTWEPGDLTSHEQERILTDVLADIWRDCYRRENPAAQRQIFRERVANAVKCATGDEAVMRWTN